MIEENDNYIIKPYKNRQKKELYVHNKELRVRLKENPVHLIKEDLTGLTKLDKKILVKSDAYTQVVKESLEIYLSSDSDQDGSASSLDFYQKMLENLPSHIDISSGEVREGFFKHLLKELKTF